MGLGAGPGGRRGGDLDHDQANGVAVIIAAVGADKASVATVGAAVVGAVTIGAVVGAAVPEKSAAHQGFAARSPVEIVCPVLGRRGALGPGRLPVVQPVGEPRRITTAYEVHRRVRPVGRHSVRAVAGA